MSMLEMKVENERKQTDKGIVIAFDIVTAHSFMMSLKPVKSIDAFLLYAKCVLNLKWIQD